MVNNTIDFMRKLLQLYHNFNSKGLKGAWKRVADTVRERDEAIKQCEILSNQLEYVNRDRERLVKLLNETNIDPLVYANSTDFCMASSKFSNTPNAVSHSHRLVSKFTTIIGSSDGLSQVHTMSEEIRQRGYNNNTIQNEPAEASSSDKEKLLEGQLALKSSEINYLKSKISVLESEKPKDAGETVKPTPTLIDYIPKSTFLFESRSQSTTNRPITSRTSASSHNSYTNDKTLNMCGQKTSHGTACKIKLTNGSKCPYHSAVSSTSKRTEAPKSRSSGNSSTKNHVDKDKFLKLFVQENFGSIATSESGSDKFDSGKDELAFEDKKPSSSIK
jgi:hypothetical protein